MVRNWVMMKTQVMVRNLQCQAQGFPPRLG